MTGLNDQKKGNRKFRISTPAMLYKVVRTTISGVRVPNNAWPAHLQKKNVRFIKDVEIMTVTPKLTLFARYEEGIDDVNPTRAS